MVEAISLFGLTFIMVVLLAFITVYVGDNLNEE